MSIYYLPSHQTERRLDSPCLLLQAGALSTMGESSVAHHSQVGVSSHPSAIYQNEDDNPIKR